MSEKKKEQAKKRLSSVLCALMCTGLLTVSANAWAADNIYGTMDGKGTTVETDAVTTGGKLNLGFGSVYDNAYGGYDASDAGANKNEVTINKGVIINEHIYGGYSENGTANENKITINDGYIGDEVYGGYANGDGNASGNQITINGGHLNDDIHGGYTDGIGDSNNNKIILNDGYIESEVYGGYANGEGNANGNQIIATGGTFGCCVYGAHANGNANGNKITLSNLSVDTSIYGGYADGDANNNEITLTNVSVGSNIGGGYADGNANGNKISLTNVKTDYDVIGGHADGDSCNNEIFLDNCIIAGDVNGGESNSYSDRNVSNNNKITIIDSVVEDKVSGGHGINEAKDNQVIINNSTINNDVNGGISEDGIADNNVVKIKDTLVKGDVYGGYIDQSASADNLSAQNNTVVLDSAVVTGTVYGGYHNSDTATIKGNKLEVIGTKNAAENIKNFDTLNFFISKDMVNNDVMLTVKDTADIENATVKAGVELGSKLNAGDQITLIDAATLNADGINTGTLTDGLLQTEISITKDENKLVASIDSISHDREVNSTTPEAKSPVETQAAMLSVLNAGNDLLATAGFDSAASVVEDELYGSLHPFVISSANKMRVESGSHVDVKGWNLNIGLAKKLKNNSGELLIAPVVEYGRGSYDSYLDNGTHGEGDAHFWGAGLIAKQTNEDGLYYEGSLRLGKASTDYKSAIAGGISYDSDATYYAAHAGLGKIVTINDSDSLDYYGKLFYTRQQGDKVTVGNNATYDFDAITSLRSRIGARYTHKMDAKNAVYAGLAWHHEFDGEANAIVTTTLGSGSAPSPSVKGDTGIMELGWTANSDKLELGLGVNGSVGKQKGVGFTLKLDFKF